MAHPACYRQPFDSPAAHLGIEVHELYPNASVQRDNGELEIDLLIVNDTEAVLIEVKSKLIQGDADDHLKRLEKFLKFIPRYRDVNALGIVGRMAVPNKEGVFSESAPFP